MMRLRARNRVKCTAENSPGSNTLPFWVVISADRISSRKREGLVCHDSHFYSVTAGNSKITAMKSICFS